MTTQVQVATQVQTSLQAETHVEVAQQKNVAYGEQNKLAESFVGAENIKKVIKDNADKIAKIDTNDIDNIVKIAKAKEEIETLKQGLLKEISEKVKDKKSVEFNEEDLNSIKKSVEKFKENVDVKQKDLNAININEGESSLKKMASEEAKSQKNVCKDSIEGSEQIVRT